MAFNYSPRVITDGLVMCLDAANTRSYPGSGTAWADLSRSGINGTLVNDPTFNSANGGSIVFDGANDYVDCGNPSTLPINTGTICVWFKTSSPGSSFRGIITKQNNYGLFTNSSVLITYDWGNAAIRSTGINIADGNWRYITLSFTNNTGTPSNNAMIYVNGISILTTTIKTLANNVNLELGRGGSGSPEQVINGNLGLTQIYNRTLSATEILQNYNATKTRFGL